ncbi:hypothetical protein Taro_014020 [Colocasia esculenta]|uniref:RING-type E3 ubiquitin transferase n=1 Tax=Colocasia esculenta TaxID=4460 RepID=A0A843UHU4_COLES|nr:hypothetical protein [Colocasia esculenta]
MESRSVLAPPLTRNQMLPTPPPDRAYPTPPNHPPPSTADTSFPILAISILGILTTAILLVSYYVFVIKCCLNWRRTDVLGRLSSSRSRLRRWREHDLFTVYASAAERRGLEEAAIQAIPTFRFRKGGGGGGGGEKGGLLHECAVCLNEFEEGEGLRRLPGCAHAFHVDCIDTWLQSNANCPLCRADIAAAGAVRVDQVFAQGADHHEPLPHSGSVVIDVGDDDSDLARRSDSTSPSTQQPQPPQAAAPPAAAPKKGRRRLHHISSMGDECIEGRPGKDEQFVGVQPVRRSFSMDSSCDRQLYLAVQEILQQNPHFCYSREIPVGEGSSSSNGGGHPAARVRRSFFSFGRSSRSSAVLPVAVDP